MPCGQLYCSPKGKREVLEAGNFGKERKKRDNDDGSVLEGILQNRTNLSINFYFLYFWERDR